MARDPQAGQRTARPMLGDAGRHLRRVNLLVDADRLSWRIHDHDE